MRIFYLVLLTFKTRQVQPVNLCASVLHHHAALSVWQDRYARNMLQSWKELSCTVTVQ